MIQRFKWTLLGLGIGLSLIPQLASAHLVSTRFGEFYSGLLHPTSTLIHLLPWVTLGLMAGLQNTAIARRGLLLFPIAVGVGTALGTYSIAVDTVDWINRLSLLIIGGAVLCAWRFKASAFVCIVCGFGFSHGLANGVSTLKHADLVLYLAGVTTAAYISFTLSTAIAHRVSQFPGWGTIAVRALGSWMAAIGVLYLGFTLFKPLAIS